MRTITLSGPGKNSLSTELMTDLAQRLEAADGQPVLLTGEGDAFSAGLNLKEVSRLDSTGVERFLRLLDRVCVGLYTHPAPIVALVNGHAIAGGSVLVNCCDYRVAVDNPRARIGLNEVALGLRFPPTVLRICRRRIPQRFHEQVFLGGALHSPTAALALGLIDEVSPDAPTRARAVLEQLAAHPPAAYAATKADLRSDPGSTPEEEQRFREQVLPIWTSAEVKQRIDAILGR
jgi:enoyl-CoA hydratase